MLPARRLGRSALALALGVAPLLTSCALIDLLGGGTGVEDALEYLPANTTHLRFSDRAAMAERLGVDDIDPRDVSQDDLDDYTDALEAEPDTAAAITDLTDDAEAMKDAPFNEFDIQWEVFAIWPDEVGGAADLWKVGDDVDYDGLVDDLEDAGYEARGDGIYAAAEGVDLGDGTATIGDPHRAILVDEDEQVIAAADQVVAIMELVDVIDDDVDSLADGEGMDDLLDLAPDDDPEVAWLESSNPCHFPGGIHVKPRVAQRYAGLGRPEERAFFVTGDDGQDVLLALRYGSDEAAESDLEARRKLVESGADPVSRKAFAGLGDFDLERKGDLLLIEEDYDGGSGDAAFAERVGGGPGACLPDVRD